MHDDQVSFKRLIDIGIALSTEKDSNRLMEIILLEAKDLSSADGGTLYIRNKSDELEFTIVRTDSLNFAQGGTTGDAITLPPVKMFTEDGTENLSNIVSYVANTGVAINVADAYETDKFDFSGTKIFDQRTGYRSKSFLTVPLKDSSDEVIGVLQLLNCTDTEGGAVTEFSVALQPLIEALASQAAVSLENSMLIESQRNLLDSFIELMASAVDAKSPYTGGHCQRVPELTKMLTKAVCDVQSGPFAAFDLNEEQWYELHIGAWLHDCGKVTTPEYVVDKATKLETITDRIHEVRMRFEVVKREAVIDYQQQLLSGDISQSSQAADELKVALVERLAQIDSDFDFIAKSNLGGEFMSDEDIARIEQIAQHQWTRTIDDRIGISFEESRRKSQTPAVDLPCIENLLSDRADHIVAHDQAIDVLADGNQYGFKMTPPEHKYNLGEVYNLTIRRGTLTEEERFKINEHIIQTIVMLENLPFPKQLEGVPEIAGGHHEKMDGTGYPKQLDGKTMSIPARVMAIADVFEALTAADRPYKKPKKLSESLKIMGFMVKDQHLDGELYNLFLSSGVYLQYAEMYLEADQIDAIDINDYIQA